MRVVEYPNKIAWVFDDGTEVVFDDADLSDRATQMQIAATAEELGLGCRRKIADFLKGRVGDGPILPLPPPLGGSNGHGRADLGLA